MKQLITDNDTFLTAGLKNIAAEYPLHQTITGLFEEQAAATPCNNAVLHGTAALTYRELDEKSNQLGHYLRKMGVTEDTLVPIVSDRSADLIVSMLAVLKAGGAYVPVEPDLPEDRINYILGDCNPPAVISCSKYASVLKAGKHKLVLTDADAAEIQKEPAGKVNSNPTPGSLAYVIYTSGSTGLPKGVLIEHRNVVRLFKSESRLFDFGENDVWTMFHSPSFDFSVWEMYGALLFGGSVVIVPKKTASDTAAFARLLIQYKVTVLNQTPSAFYVLQDYFTELTDKTTVRYVIFGGEALMPGRIKKWFDKYTNCSLINMYGITETTVHVTFLKITAAHIKSGKSNIGYPIPTLGIMILDGTLNTVPPGEPGEMYVAGAGVARGYLNRKSLTSERFLQNAVINGQPFPFRIYKSGDLAKWESDGSLTYLGRADSQLKIRGHRIEPGEVENVLQQHPHVSSAVVLSREAADGNSFLIGFVVVNDRFSRETALSFLARKLPAYMIPDQWVTVPQIPLTANGKTDRAGLLKLFDEQTAGTALRTFNSPVENEIALIWKNILKTNPAGRDISFFEAGGHSLMLLELSGQLSKKFNCSIPAVSLYEYTTISQQAVLADTFQKNSAKPHAGSTAGIQEQTVTATQKMLFIRHKLNPSDFFPNSSVTFQITGNPDLSKLESGIKQIVADNESLRTFFYLEKGEICAGITDTAGIALQTINQEKNLPETIWELTKAFRFRDAPLLRLYIITLQNNTRFLHLDMPHIISDGHSLNVIIRQLISYYNGSYSSENTAQFSRFSHYLRQYLGGNAYKQDEAYWTEIAAGLNNDAPLPGIFSAQAGDKNVAAGGFSGRLDDDLYQSLKKFIQGKNLTLFQFLLAAYCLLLKKLTGESCAKVTVPVDNRQEPGLENVIGLLVNAVFIKTAVSAQDTAETYLNSCRSVFMNALKHGRYPLEAFYALVPGNSQRKKSALSNFFFSYNHIPEHACQTADFKLDFVLPPKNREDQELSMALYDTETELKIGLSSSRENMGGTALADILRRYACTIRLLMCSSKEEKITSIINKI